jgi:hypothetical protein
MTKYRDLLREFIESVRGKDFSEIIILADREATQAYRNALRSCHEPHHNYSGWCQYSKTLTNMIHFLRSEVKPKKTESFAYPLFYSVQNGIEQKNQEFFRSCMAKHERLKPVSHG